MNFRYWIVKYQVGMQIERSVYPPSGGVQVLDSFSDYGKAIEALEKLKKEQSDE